MGEHMVDMVDPESVDFEPLLQSDNGAAMTDVQGQMEGMLDRPSDISSEHLLEEEVGMDTAKVFSTNGEDGEVNGKINNESSQLYQQKKDDMEPEHSYSRSFPAEEKQNRLWSFVRYYYHHFIRRLTSCRSLSLSSWTLEPSITSSIVICTAFFTIVMLSSAVSTYVATITGVAGQSTHNKSLNNLPDSSPATRSNMNQLSPQGVGLAPFVGTNVPPKIRKVFADVEDVPIELMDTAVFWHVPRSAGTTMKHVFATCLGRVITTEVGGMEGHNVDERLELIRQSHGVFVNVDTTTPGGLKHGKELGLAQSKMADVIFTPYIQEAAILFDENHRGRFFTLLRNPIDRIVSLYYYKRMATWEPNYDPELKDKTLSDFVESYGENWMVRTLTGTMSGALDVIHLQTAKEILRRKFLIGLLEEKTESLRRFEEYFGWKFPSPVSQTCKNNMFYFEWHSGNPHPPLENEELKSKIRNLNMWDMALYDYAIQLFQEQEKLFWNSDSSTTYDKDLPSDSDSSGEN